MKLYLIQHGESENKDVNPDRPLTARGWEDIKKLSIRLAAVKPAKTYHSGKLRAKQTAEIIARAKPIEQRADMNPNDPIDPLVKEIHAVNLDQMIVGHLPFLSKLACYLLVGNPECNIINFKQGSCLCLERKDSKWSTSFMLTPDIL
ncbi:phosphohistidine phosphatase SixA [Candidatus Margulisiibacteriota bacterium]